MGIMMDFEATCALDGTSFTYASTPSYSIMGRALDGMPHGSWMFPLKIPECPTCRLPAVFDKLSPEERKRATAFLESDAWRAAEGDTSYWRLNAIEEVLGRSTALRRVDRLLSATWQVHGDLERYGRYARELGQAMDSGSVEIGSKYPESWSMLQSFVANVERQAGDFKRAAARLDQIEASGQRDDALTIRLDLTRQLIADGSRARHLPDR